MIKSGDIVEIVVTSDGLAVSDSQDFALVITADDSLAASVAPSASPTSASPTIAPDCESTCFGQTCDDWSDSCETLQSVYNCDCRWQMWRARLSRRRCQVDCVAPESVAESVDTRNADGVPTIGQKRSKLVLGAILFTS